METGAFSAAAPHQATGLGLGGGGAVDEQQAAGVGILLQISMLVLSFVLGHLLRRRKFYYLPEASASLLIGTVHTLYTRPSALDPRRLEVRNADQWRLDRGSSHPSVGVFAIVVDAMALML